MKVLFSICALLLCFIFTPKNALAQESDHLILINLSTNQLSFFEHGKYIRTFPIASGKKATPTPEGMFCVINKYKNKKYHIKNIEGGTSNNPLGTRWMGLNKAGYAIHGTNREGSIGSYASNGCIRMHDKHIQWLYDRVPLQTKVIITHFYGSIEKTAHRLGYRVISWRGMDVGNDQIGELRIIKPTALYWQEPNGQLTSIRTLLPNEKYAVVSHNGQGMYYIGNRLYIKDTEQTAIRYEQIPNYIIVNQYKRKLKSP
ncbi:L,D-transpeptidase [Microbacteriaceae bacterium 4G12]